MERDLQKAAPAPMNPNDKLDQAWKQKTNNTSVADKPATPAAQPVAKPAEKPAAKPAQQPAARPAAPAKPVAEPVYTPVTAGRDQPIKAGPTPFEEPGVDKDWYTPLFAFDDRIIPWDYNQWGRTPPAPKVIAPPVVQMIQEQIRTVPFQQPMQFAPFRPSPAPFVQEPIRYAPQPYVQSYLNAGPSRGPLVLRP